MSTTPLPPRLDDRSYDQLVTDTQALAQVYTATGCDTPWAPDPDGALDPGATLIRLFARMATEAIERLNQVPEKNHLAFLDLLGAQQLPPMAARVPLTFHPIDGSTVEPVVPAGTQVAAPAQGALPEAVFATETDLVLSRAVLQGVFVRDAGNDSYTDATAAATLASPGPFAAFVGAHGMLRGVYFKCDALYTLAGASSLGVTLGFASQDDAQNFNQRPVTWWSWVGDAFVPLPASAVSTVLSTAAPWTLTVSVTLPAPPGTTTVHGIDGAFLLMTANGQTTAPSPAIVGITTNANFSTTPASLGPAYDDSFPVDLTRPFQPFGATPAYGDVFYVACSDALSKPGVSAVLTASSPGISGTVAAIVEVSTASGWSGVGTLSLAPSTAPPPPSLTFPVPANAAATMVNSRSGFWLRLRFTTVPSTSIWIDNLTLTYSGTVSAAPEAAFSSNDLCFVDWSPPTALIAFVPVPPITALYLGFDRAFANRAQSLFFQVVPPTASDVAPVVQPVPSSPRVVWEFSAGYDREGRQQWRDLGAVDETSALTQSGLLRFIGPLQAAPILDFGKNLFWLRGKNLGSFAFPPQLSAVLGNTVWADDAVTSAAELLGSSDGSPNQQFSTAQSPVLLGERIEVDEPQPPTPEALLLLVEAMGPDVVTEVPAAPGQPAQTWVRWLSVTDFNASGPGDRVYVMDYLAGVVHFGDGSNGMVPPGNRNIRAASYRSGGGSSGNRDAATVTQLKQAVAYVDSVTNQEPADGGSNAETLEHLKDRTSTTIRHGRRAVAAQDFEDLAFEASTMVARAHAVTPVFQPIDPIEAPVGAGVVLLIIVPVSAAAQPVPGLELLSEVQSFLAARCAPAVTLAVSGPSWSTVTVTASVSLTSIIEEESVNAAIQVALDSYLHPLTGGADGTGWPFGRQPAESELYAVVASVPGVSFVASLSRTIVPPIDPPTGDPRLPETVLICSGDHVIHFTGAA